MVRYYTIQCVYYNSVEQNSLSKLASIFCFKERKERLPFEDYYMTGCHTPGTRSATLGNHVSSHRLPFDVKMGNAEMSDNLKK